MSSPKEDPRPLNPSERFSLLFQLAEQSTKSEDEEPLADVIHDLLEISPQLQFQAKKVTDAMDLYMPIEAATETPEGDAFGQLHPEAYVILRLGFYAQIYEAYRLFRQSIIRFFRDPNNNPDQPAIQKKFRTRPDALAVYKAQFLKAQEAASSIDIAVSIQWGEWMNRTIQPGELSPESPFTEVAGNRIGPVLMERAKTFVSKREKQLEEADYVGLAELLIIQLQEEKKRGQKVIPSATADDDPLVKNLFKIAVCNYRAIGRGEVKKLPKAMADAMVAGEPLYRLFAAFMTQLIDALSDSTHSGHLLSFRLVELLNSFDVEEWGSSELLRTMPFTHQLGFGLTQRDYLRSGDFQQFICDLEELAVLHPENTTLYHRLMEQLILSSRSYEVAVVCEGGDVERIMFDSERRVISDISFGEKLKELTHSTDDLMFLAGFNEGIVPITLLPLTGEKYYLGLETRELEENAYIVNAQLTVRNGENTHKLRFQIRLVNDMASIYFPVFNRELIEPDTEITAIELVHALMSLIHADTGKPEVPPPAALDAPPEKRISNRRLKIAEYERQQEIRIAAESMTEGQEEEQEGDSTERVTRSSSAERELASHYLPSELIVPAALQRKMDSANKKGAEARVFGIVEGFVTAYNAAPAHQKPGEGEQMSDVHGPDRQKVWRLKPAYGVRCIIVDLGGGKALLVDADTRANIYKVSGKEMRRLVGIALEKYFRRG